jgi:hypothetical protein
MLALKIRINFYLKANEPIEQDEEGAVMSKEQDTDITVNDRRMFNPDGTLRQPLSVEAAEEQKPEEQKAPEQKASPEPHQPDLKSEQRSEPRSEPKSDPKQDTARGGGKRQPRPGGTSAEFSNLIGMLTTNAILHLGIDPTFGKGNVDLETARHFIDMLAVLKEKTEGNLTEEESQLLDDMVSRLRMEYVGVANQLSASAKNAKK